MAKSPKKSAKYSRENLRLFFTNAIWAYKEIFRIAKWDSILIFLTIISTAILPTAVTYFTARILDELIILISNGATIEEAFSSTSANPLLISIIVLFVIKLLMLWSKKSSAFLKLRLENVHIFRYIGEFYKKLSTLDIQSFENKETANIINKAEKQVFRLSGFLSISIRMFSDILTTVLQAIIIFSVSPLLLVILTAATIPGIFIRISLINDFWEQHNLNQERWRKRRELTHSISSLATLPELKASGGLGFFYKKLDLLSDKIAKSQFGVRITEYRRDMFDSVLFALKELYAPLIFVPMVLVGKISIGDFSFYSVSTRRYSEIATNLLGAVTNLYDASIAISDVREVFQMSSGVNNGDRKLDPENNPTIEFKEVTFKYPGTKKTVLKDINFQIETGDEIALVGENGAGKTTLIKLLLRFYDPSDGEILLDGINIKDIDINTYYEKIGVLFQDFNFYQGITIEENITIGVKNKSINDSLKMAEVYDDVTDLEKGPKSTVGRMFTDGIDLSKGQKQKLAIARMFHQNSPILILDEPTASIDAVAEYRIFKRIFDFMEDKTVIIISHRFSTVRNAQKIYVLDKGKIIEEGSHKELLKKNGKYKEAFDLQAEGYN